MKTFERIDNSLGLNFETVKKIITGFLHDGIHTAGFTKGVIGLSGGIDSTVSAFLAAEALGRKNVTAVMMPYESSSKESVTHAELVIEKLGINGILAPITPFVDPLFKDRKISDNIRRGNVMARARMILLYDYSAALNALVIGTSNKTESLLGYGTVFGDMASALNPLGDLYKTQIWELAKYLNVPAEIIQKKPSADLWSGQSDEGELGFSYKDVDRLLFAMVDERRSVEELRSFGFKGQFINHVTSLIKKSQFKRRPPVVAKISYRTINIDFRYIRDWGI